MCPQINDSQRYKCGAAGLPLMVALIVLSAGLSACGMRTVADCLISGNEYFKAGDYKKAESEYREALRRDEKNSTAMNNLGVILTENGKYEEAVAVLNRATRKDPKNYIAFWSLAKAQLKMNANKDAFESAKRAVYLAPSELSCHMVMAQAAFAVGNFANAIDECRYVISESSDDSEAHQLLAQALEKQGDYDGATLEWARALEIKPGNKEVRTELMRMLGAYPALKPKTTDELKGIVNKYAERPEFADLCRKLSSLK